ncbi:AMP-binding protein [Aminobacter sp. SR38]|jgi:acyl-CoA synthetase (AMP-forming)/AMP-acid ligase II|uniref:class I adenylate-forming enzyme family protein n=1 Tax=Aminobacter TaxID=31988 RepID=UPI00177CA4DD|nr:AMP-binding protein [Aminobacter sp. SR38]QOF71783.1 AMP-binding protein [Aminobacter sp. SR38]
MEILSQVLARNARLIGERNFIVTDKETITYARFAELTAQLANVLKARGVAKGDRVGLYLPSTPMMAIGFWACQRLGAIPAPLSAMFRHAELRKIVAQTGMKALVADSSTWPYFSEIRAEFADLAHCLVVSGDGSTDDLTSLMATAPATFEDVACHMDDICALFFTSGTTGAPKGAAQSQFNQCSTLRDMMVSHRTRFAEEVYLCAVPLFTNFGLTVTLNLCLYTGGTIVLHERWDTQRVLSEIGEYKATYFGGTPTMYVYMVNEVDPAKHDLSSLRICTTGGSPVPQPVIRRFEELSGARVTQVYGSTETSGQNVMEPTAGIRKPGSAGLPVGSSRISIVDDEGNAVPQGQIGEVIISGDCVAQGYWMDEKASAEAFGNGGWKSGDLGYVDEDGYLFIVDRKKDVIIAGGHNVYPLEIEALLYKHPAVAMCAVVGAPDESKGEIPVAVIVKAEGQDATADELIRHCRESLAAYKAPRAVHFIDTMPVEAAKIRKRELVLALRENRLDDFRNK